MTPLTGDENSISSSRPWVSQVPRLICARALSPLTPEGSSSAPARCFPADARLRLFWQRGRLHQANEAETGSLALRLARSPCEASRAPLLDTHARLATYQTGNYRVGTFHPTRSARLSLAHQNPPKFCGLLTLLAVSAQIEKEVEQTDGDVNASARNNVAAGGSARKAAT